MKPKSAAEAPIDSVFCEKAIAAGDFFVVPDTRLDARFSDNPLVTGEPGLRFYAGAVLKTSAGLPIGTVCVLDYRPRELSAVQEQTLRVLARQVMSQLDLRRALKEAANLRGDEAALVQAFRASEERARLAQ